MSDPRRLLIVDDEPNVRLMFRTAMESTGAAVVEAPDGEAALAALAGARFDLVLLDLRMPGLGGMETIRRLRSLGDDTPVVIVTAHGSVPDAVEAMKLGAIDFLTKPITPEALRRVVAAVCDRGRLAGGDAPTPDQPVTLDGQFALNLARAKRSINRRDTPPAEVFLRQALALRPDSVEAQNLLGVLLELRDDRDGSFRAYRAALKVDPAYEPARHNLTRYYEKYTFGKSSVPIDTGAPL